MNRLVIVTLAVGLGFAQIVAAPLGRADTVATVTGGYSPAFRVGGEVLHAVTYTPKALASLPPTKLNVFFNTGTGPVQAAYTGVLLWDLLTASVIATDPTIKNDLLRKSVVVEGSDGYRAVFAAGELAPQFGGQQVIVAYAQDGKPLDQAIGFARIVAPGDKAGGRNVQAITRIWIVGCK